MNFIKFDGYTRRQKRCHPHLMKVGQVVERRKPCRTTRWRLVADMRRAMKQGMEFSVSEEGDIYAIRRDK